MVELEILKHLAYNSMTGGGIEKKKNKSEGM